MDNRAGQAGYGSGAGSRRFDAAATRPTDPKPLPAPAPARSDRGFTLLELIVVVIIIGVIALLAVPAMRLAVYDRHAYQDAGAIMQLFREARMRAVARGGAMMVSLTANGPAERGQFMLYEAVTQDPNDPNHGYQMPVASCKPPTVWSGLTQNLVDGVSLDGQPEADADIETQIYQYQYSAGGVPVAITSPLYICYTPLGRSYIATGV